MKRIVSVSIGSSTRDHRVFTRICGIDFQIERIGTDGDIKKAIRLIQELDGKVDAFGMGGIDLYLYGKNHKRYMIRAAFPIANAAKITPIVDGSGLKNTLERNLIQYVNDVYGIPLKNKKVLLVSALDRYGMAEAFHTYGCQMTFGDVMFALGIPIPIRKLDHLYKLAGVLLPIFCQMPFEFLYPTGQNQEKSTPKFEKYYKAADIIAGDFLYIKRYMPERLDDKIIITNTVTSKDVEDLKSRGVRTLITSTPELDGRSFGTNVIEAVLVSLSGQRPENLTPEIYESLLKKSGIQHRVIQF